MQRNNMTRPVAFALIIFIFVILFVAVFVAALVLRTSAGPSGTDLEGPDIASVEPPEPLPSDEPEPSPEPVPSEAPEPSEEPEPEAPESGEPPRIITSPAARMRIPGLSLDYEIQSMGADSSGTMLIARGIEVVSWFDRSAIPGNEGNAIFGAHNQWSGERSKIFTLDELEIGDELEIEYEDGTILRFFLESVFVYELRTAPAHLIMDTAGDARLTLITCKPPFNPATGTSDNRIVAIFKEEGVFVIPDPPVEKFPLKED